MRILHYQVKLGYGIMINYVITWLQDTKNFEKLPVFIVKIKTGPAKGELKELKIISTISRNKRYYCRDHKLKYSA